MVRLSFCQIIIWCYVPNLQIAQELYDGADVETLKENISELQNLSGEELKQK